MSGSSAIQARRSTRLGRLTLTVLLLAVALLLVLVLAVQHGLLQLQWPPISVVIDGEEVFSGIDLSTLPPGQSAGLVGGVTLALLIIAVVLPLTLLAVAAMVLVIVLIAVGLPLLAVGAVFMLLLSPLLLLGLLLWWWLRPSTAARSATIGE